MVFRLEPDCSPILLLLNSTRPALPAWWCLTFARRVRVSAGDNAANVEGVDCSSQSKQHVRPRADHGMERRTETRRIEATGPHPNCSYSAARLLRVASFTMPPEATHRRDAVIQRPAASRTYTMTPRHLVVRARAA